MGELERYCPTVTAKTVEVSASGTGGGRHYWVIDSYFQASVPRGMSIYRKLEAFVPVNKVRGTDAPAGTVARGLLTRITRDLAKESYRVPNGLDVTVAAFGPDDAPDRIAHLVASLRCGYGHSPMATALPAPLSFESKARDYMARFTLHELDADDGDPAMSPDRRPTPAPDEDGVSDGLDEETDDSSVLDAAEAAADISRG